MTWLDAFFDSFLSLNDLLIAKIEDQWLIMPQVCGLGACMKMQPISAEGMDVGCDTDNGLRNGMARSKRVYGFEISHVPNDILS